MPIDIYGTSERNKKIFDCVVSGDGFTKIARDIGVTATTVRNIFHKEVKRRFPDLYGPIIQHREKRYGANLPPNLRKILNALRDHGVPVSSPEPSQIGYYKSLAVDVLSGMSVPKAADAHGISKATAGYRVGAWVRHQQWGRRVYGLAKQRQLFKEHYRE